MVNSYYTVIFLCVIYNVYTFSSQNVWMKPMFGPFKKPKQSLRVYDGVFDHNNEYIYVVALGFMANATIAKILFDRSVEGEGPFFVRGCSGSLVSPLWVLSAQHCVGNGGPEDTPSHIRYGNTTIPPDEKSFSYSRVRKRISHVKADIGLILLQEQDKVSLPTYGVMSAVDYKTLAGLTVKYVGYGVTQIPPIPIQEEEVKFAFKNQTKNRRIGEALVVPCRHYMKTLYKLDLFEYRSYFSTPKICIVPKCSQRLAAGLHGDSGGPMLRLGRIVGVFATWTRNFQPTNTLTPVSPYMDWISSVMSLNQ